MSRVTTEDVRTFRAAYGLLPRGRDGRVLGGAVLALARRVGLPLGTLTDIVQGRTWAGVSQPPGIARRRAVRRLAKAVGIVAVMGRRGPRVPRRFSYGRLAPFYEASIAAAREAEVSKTLFG